MLLGTGRYKPRNEAVNEMIDLSIFQAVGLGVVFVVTFAVLMPYLPPWAVYTIEVGIVFHALVRIIIDGPTGWNVTRVIIFSTLAAIIWWRHLRGTRGGRPPEP